MEKHTSVVHKRRLQTLAVLIVLVAGLAAFGPRVFVADVKTMPQVGAGAADSTNQLPEIMDLHHKEIGIGQRWTFGVEVIDEEGDLVRTELISKPKSAKFNQNTLTVDWTPKKSDGKRAKFVVRVTEIPRDKSRASRTVTKEMTVKIVNKPVKLLKMPEALLEVDTLVTVIDPERLSAVSKKWTMLNLFQRIAEIEADKQIKPGSEVKPTSGAQLFRDAMKELAVIHNNPAIDPDSPRYNPEWNAEHWKLIAVRPRLNKKVFELRLVYFNTKAPEQSYLMPRMRIVRGKDAGRPDELRQKNNMVVAKMLHDEFFDGENLKPFVAGDKAKYSEALERFVTRFLTYNDPDDPMMRGSLAAIPHNSRLGGGNNYDPDGKYLNGDGWALGAIKIAPVARDGKKVLGFTSPFIDGFAASIKPNKDGTAFRPVPPPATDPSSTDFIKGWDHLIDEDDKGNIAIPLERPDGTIVRSNIDTSLNRFELQTGFRFSENSLRDARRRIFEERGMTCMQCHVRNFDEGNYLSNLAEPSANGATAVEAVPRVFFIITPTLHSGRNEYMRRTEIAQVGGLQGVFRDYLGIKVKINSPLTPEWPFTTKKGKY